MRVFNFLSGVITILFGYIMFDSVGDSYLIVIYVLQTALILRGIRLLIYYVSMARHMVGGKVILYQGAILFDIGIFTLMVGRIPQIYAMIYLVAGLAISGIVDLLRTREIRRLESGYWKYEAFTGTVKVIAAVTSLFFLDSQSFLVKIYSVGLFQSGVGKISTAVRRSAIVYIE